LTQRLLSTLLALAAAILAVAARAEDAPATNDETELAKKLQNPVAALISVPFHGNFEWGIGHRSRGFKYTLDFQPVIPIKLTDDWNVISRTIVPIIQQDDVVPGTTQGGLGDTTQSLFFSPSRPGPLGLIWGVGPVALLPTSTEDFLGAQKFGLGPTGVVLRQDGGGPTACSSTTSGPSAGREALPT
jgi:hypothetical protein